MDVVHQILFEVNLGILSVTFPIHLSKLNTQFSKHKSEQSISLNRRKPVVKFNRSTCTLTVYFVDETGKDQIYFERAFCAPIDHETISFKYFNDGYFQVRMKLSDFSFSRRIKDIVSTSVPRLEEKKLADSVSDLLCKACSTRIVSLEYFDKVDFAPALPWSHLLDTLTCIHLEEYNSATRNAAFNEEKLNPKSNVIMLSKTGLMFKLGCIKQVSTSMKKVYCSRCQEEIGKVLESSLMLFKHKVTTANNYFEVYNVAVFVANTLIENADSSSKRELFIALSNEVDRFLSIKVLSYPVIISSGNDPIAKAFVRVLYREIDAIAENVEMLTMSLRDYSDLHNVLKKSSRLLPSKTDTLLGSTIAFLPMTPNLCNVF